MDKLSVLMNNTFQSLPFFPILSYLTNMHSLTFIPRIPQEILNTFTPKCHKEKRECEPTKKRALNPRADKKKQPGTRGHLDKSWRTKYKEMHLGNTLPQRVRGTYQRYTNSLLSTRDERVHIELEEREGPDTCNGGVEALLY
ncbi:hypothetical protein KY290_001183 [Solanum tuberosum]|uniref:Uncharacterized protein n=1 Tax=Solanum tuberosum TaxID=4113 RepID=A0ABQ7WLH6_SOLTU|nr:hypothetical protein KY290_001183 [Solanum tuberosum]